MYATTRDGRSPIAFYMGLTLQHGSRYIHVPFQIAVHDGEENLEKEIYGIYEYRQKVQPCFA